MITSNAGRKFIEQWEGLFLKTYADSVGVFTIGYGHTSAAGAPKVTKGMKITKEQADQILAADLRNVEADINKLVKVKLNQNQYDALASFHFNTGALGRSTLLKLLNAGQYDKVPSELMKYNKGTIDGAKVAIKGLTNRRVSEGQLWNKKPSQTTSHTTATTTAIVSGFLVWMNTHRLDVALIVGGTLLGCYIIYKLLRKQ